jgi:2,3-dihydroxy-p-cumate/2,3-dihydroxybenzoate 3,4-dioxygenase
MASNGGGLHIKFEGKTERSRMNLSMPSLLVAVAYVRIETTDTVASANFAEETVGLQRASQNGSEATLRADDRAQSLAFVRDAEPSVGIEVWDEGALELLESRLNEAKFVTRRASAEEARLRCAQTALIARDKTGNIIEFVARPERSGRRFFGARDAGITGLAGIGLRSKDVKGDLRFWRAAGAEVSDYVGEIAYLAIDERHHRLSLYPSKTSGPLYVAFEVASLDDVMRASYFLAERQVQIVHGPGREPASEQYFLRFRGPEGLIYAYVSGVAKHLKTGPPRQFRRADESFCAWGSVAKSIPELSV